MVPWLRKTLRSSLPPTSALADAEAELEELYAVLERGHRTFLETPGADLEAAKEQAAEARKALAATERELAELRTLKARMRNVIEGGDGGRGATPAGAAEGLAADGSRAGEEAAGAPVGGTPD